MLVVSLVILIAVPFVFSPSFNRLQKYSKCRAYQTLLKITDTAGTKRRSQVTGQGTGHRAQVTGHRSQVTGHRAQGTGHRLQGTGHRAQVIGHRKRSKNS